MFRVQKCGFEIKTNCCRVSRGRTLIQGLPSEREKRKEIKTTDFYENSYEWVPQEWGEKSKII